MDESAEVRNISSDAQWRTILEELVKKIRSPTSSETVTLPVFKPENTSQNAKAWCTTADLCMREKPVSGSALMIVLSKAMQGSSSAWLSQISFEGMTWEQFKDLFLSRYDETETGSASLIKLLRGKPKDNEPFSVYASQFLTTFMTRWQTSNPEQIGAALAMAHLSEFDPRIKRLAYTTEIDSRNQLHRELRAVSKRKFSDSEDKHHSKRLKMDFSQKCYNCGKLGHHQRECRSAKASSSSSCDENRKEVRCYKCNKPGHYANDCRSTAAKNESETKRVAFCTVKSPSG